MTGAGVRSRPGRPDPLGATRDGSGVNFALYSEHATAVELCLFDPADPRRETHRVPVTQRTDLVWHVCLPDSGPGEIYGYRVHGPWQPSAGHRFNPAKVLIDPYTRAIAGNLTWSGAAAGQRAGTGASDAEPDDRDDAPYVPKSVVVDGAYAWGDDRPPRTPWHRTVIYEMHVKGFTARHPGVPPPLRGTYAGLASAAAIEHLTGLGITAVELLPVHHSVSEGVLRARGLSNYWGYNTIGYFAPDARYASAGDRGGQVAEFKAMVRALHRAGIEVILDVVYNHTAEGGATGPTLSFRGIDNTTYYRLVPDNGGRYVDVTGCGNTVNTMHPQALKLVMDSLRYWVVEMHVDGFRFDLASALARGPNGVDRFSPFLSAVRQDPVLSRVKLIAEPWDLGEGGYQVGSFPVGWAEWNDKYRDTVRRYWRGDERQVSELAFRLTGSSDLFEASRRGPHASVNFVTVHDGFTLNDLVSYTVKRNEANGEDNRDGSDNNVSWNGGVEGPTDDPKVIDVRERQMRNFLATLLLSQGVPMLCAGDELARSQRGNNNAYCQDNSVSWLGWTPSTASSRQLAFTRRLIRLRQDHPVFHRRTFFRGRRRLHEGSLDVVWYRSDGKEMTEDDWNNGLHRCLGVRLAGDAIDEVDDAGQRVADGTFLLLLNAHDQSLLFVMPAAAEAPAHWQPVLDTRAWDGDGGGRVYLPGEVYDLDGRSLAVLRLATEPAPNRALAAPTGSPPTPEGSRAP